MDDLKICQSPSPDAVADVGRQRWNSPRINVAKRATACLTQLSDGINDSAPGALLPYIEKHYGVKDTVVSMIFIHNSAGGISAVLLYTVLRFTRNWLTPDCCRFAVMLAYDVGF